MIEGDIVSLRELLALGAVVYVYKDEHDDNPRGYSPWAPLPPLDDIVGVVWLLDRGVVHIISLE